MRRITIILILILSALNIGCVKARFALAVNEDGSGTIGVAMGMTPEAKALASSEEVDPINELASSFSEDSDTSQEMQVTTWTEGEYEWVQADRIVNNLDEMNSFLEEMEIFNDFSLTRRRGILKNQFVLDATIYSLFGDYDLSEDMLFDPTGFFDFDLTVSLPGEVVESNGVYDANANSLSWSIDYGEQIPIYAVSEYWNIPNIIIVVCMLLLGIAAMMIFGVTLIWFVFQRREKTKTI